MSRRLLLRVHANCDGLSEGNALADRLSLALSRWDATPVGVPRRHWKQRELYEFAWTLEPATDATFDRLVALSPGGWAHEGVKRGDRSSAWTRAQDAVFLAPEVKGAELQLQLHAGD